MHLSLLQALCSGQKVIIYQYDSEKNIFYEMTTPSDSSAPLLTTNLETYLSDAATNILFVENNSLLCSTLSIFYRKKIADRYIARIDARKLEKKDNFSYCQVRLISLGRIQILHASIFSSYGMRSTMN